MPKKYGKKYIAAKALITEDAYSIKDATELLKKTSVTKFDGSCEVHFNLGVDPRQADQNIRTTVELPHGTGKDVNVVAFVAEDNVAAALAAGASIAGTAELVEKIEGGWLEFDIAVAEPTQMRSLGKIAKTLGQKRLMPNPKAGTVTPEFEAAIKSLKKGKIELRVDKEGNLHNLFGKVSFDAANLAENLELIVKTIVDIKPTSTKGTYIKSIFLTTAMGPSINLDIASATGRDK